MDLLADYDLPHPQLNTCMPVLYFPRVCRTASDFKVRGAAPSSTWHGLTPSMIWGCGTFASLNR